jgi:hypothetical protein
VTRSSRVCGIDIGALVIGLALVVAGCTPGVAGVATPSAAPPGSGNPTPGATRTSASPRPVAAAPSPTPVPRPVDSTVDGVAVRSLHGRPLWAPIDVIVAFDSVWVANHHGPTVTRFNPTTMEVEATIKTGGGPGWLIATDDAVWVSNQNDVGMTRIDPDSNRTTKVGRWAPCGRSVAAFEAIWQPACDAHRIMRIDPIALTVTDINATRQTSVVRVGARLLSSGPGGLAEVDPATNSFTPIGGVDPGWMITFDGRTIWSSTEREVLRTDPDHGSTIATLAIPDAGGVAFRDGRAWVTSSDGVVEVDPRTNEIERTLMIGSTVSIANDETGLWATSYEGDGLTLIRP